MPTKKAKGTRRRMLISGRPPRIKPPASMSRKATRTLIRTHHTLEKQRVQALAAGDTDSALEISKQIEQQGGIKTYQQASLLGQANERGGDSSKVLMDWFQPVKTSLRAERVLLSERKQWRMLEVGALSTTNACSRSGLFEIERIDLNSQAESITQQDFMERPLPKDDSEQFDVISLSLVLNYVPDAIRRGEMLERTLKFLRNKSLEAVHQQPLEASFPTLFLVLPVSCVTNSRYLDDPRLEAIMQSLGYVKDRQKLSNKLAYYLWKATDLAPKKRTESFKKIKVRAGKTRNNFAIVLK